MELKKRLEQTRQALFTSKMKHKMQRLSNKMELRNFKRDIARLETALSVLPPSAFETSKDEKNKQKDSAVAKKTVAHKTKAVAQKTATQKTTTKKEAIKKELTKKQKALASKDKKETLKKEDKKTSSQKTDELKGKKGKNWLRGFFGRSKAGPRSQMDNKAGRKSFFRRKSG